MEFYTVKALVFGRSDVLDQEYRQKYSSEDCLSMYKQYYGGAWESILDDHLQYDLHYSWQEAAERVLGKYASIFVSIVHGDEPVLAWPVDRLVAEGWSPSFSEVDDLPTRQSSSTNQYDQFVRKAKEDQRYNEVFQHNLLEAERRGYFGSEGRSLAEVVTDGEMFGMAELLYRDDSIEESELPEKLWQSFEDEYVDWYEETH